MREKKDAVEAALRQFASGNLADNAKNLLNTLGYDSQRTVRLEPNTADGFLSAFDSDDINAERALCEEWDSVDVLFQLMDDQIRDNANIEIDFGGSGIDAESYQSYLFFALRLRGDQYTRTQLSQITREINKPFGMPAMVLFQHGETLTFAVIDRRLSKVDESKDVLEKATLIKDINFADPHRAHIDILFDLAIAELYREHGFGNFAELHEAWRKTLDTEALNKQFYRRLYDWFEWAVSEAKFPENGKRAVTPEEHVIRLITRLLFVWFIKEKGLVADELFNETEIARLLKDYEREAGDSYYRAVLQNLFFATLNTEIGERRFSKKANADHRNFSVYRYRDQISEHEELLDLFGKTPFINGGLFDCLDDFKATGEGGSRIDCFSDSHYKQLSVPDRLFFDEERGLFPLLTHYKFTVEENTPIEEEVALDPELLGKVFENLLAAYNPETGTTARKQTGSYYTPRVIVDYMVTEALVATLSQQCNLPQEPLRKLFDYAAESENGVEQSVDAKADEILGAIAELTVLDPAVGSGAFPMSVLHKLTLALRRLDDDNSRWEELQKERAGKRAAAAFDTSDQQERDAELAEISDTFERYRDSDFGRKLYLIQNSIFGVDIQSIACQIAKLRFFISLTIEQAPNKEAPNFGIKPLPNLETRFVAANTLIGLEGGGKLTSPKAQSLEQELRMNRERHFHAATRTQKREYKQVDEKLRRVLAAELKQVGMPDEDADRVAAWDPYDQNASADWFDAEWMFGITDGFDVVIGNPPYIQLQKDGGKLGRLYEACKFDTFIRTGDIYCLFYEKADQLLKECGHLCFITSNKWMRTGYGKKLRDYFMTHTQPIQLLDMGPNVFDATVDTNILLLQNPLSSNRTPFKAVTIKDDFEKQEGNIAPYLNDNGMPMELPAKGEPWVILSSEELALKRKIEDIGKPLQSWNIQIYRGIITGCNEAFVINESKREELIARDPKSTEIIKPLLRGRDIQRYHVRRSEMYMLATGFDIDVPSEYPAVYSYLENKGRQMDSGRRGKGLFNRDDQGENWWNLRACSYYPEFEKEKIVWKRIGSILRFAYSPHTTFCLDSTCIATGENVKILAAVLNSRLSHYQLFGLAPKTGTGDLIISVQALEPLLVPPITDANQQIVARIGEQVDNILAAKRRNPDVDTTALENEIDQIVYLLYGLTPEEIAIVEENTV